MAINLDEHAVFIDRLQMDMVPLSVAKQAIEEAYSEMDGKVDEVMALIQSSLTQINTNLTELNDQDSTRES